MKRSKLSPAARETIVCMAPLFVAAIPFVLLFAIPAISTVIDRSCAYGASIAQPTIAALQGFTCAEFFLNRYQTLLGVAGALVAAGMAAAPVWRQVKLSGMQAALQLQPVIEAMEEEIGDDSRIVASIIIIERRIDNLVFLADVAMEEGAEGPITGHIHRELIEIDDLIDIASEKNIPRFVARLRLSPDIRALRTALEGQLVEARKAVRRPVPAPNKSAQEMINEEFCRILSTRLDRLGSDIADCCRKLNSRLEAEHEQLRMSAANVQSALAGF